MTISTDQSRQPALRVPAWTTGERLRKARTDAGLTIDQMAELTSISRRQIIYYENDDKQPKRGDFLLWQMLTSVPAEWLMTGAVGPAGLEPTTSTVESHRLAPVIPIRSLRDVAAAS